MLNIRGTIVGGESFSTLLKNKIKKSILGAYFVVSTSMIVHYVEALTSPFCVFVGGSKLHALATLWAFNIHLSLELSIALFTLILHAILSSAKGR